MASTKHRRAFRAARPARYDVAAPHDANVVDARVGGPLGRASLNKTDREPRILDHLAKGLGRRAEIVFLQHYDPARAQKVADCREELAVKLPHRVGGLQ